MAEYGWIDIQNLPNGRSASLNTFVKCNRGLVFHQGQSSIVSLRGVTNCNCPNAAAVYSVRFNANVAVAEGETVGPISVAITSSGEVLAQSVAISTPTAVGAYNHVSGEARVLVPKGDFVNVSFANVSADGLSIDVQNLTVAVDVANA